ncbi:MAG TPA: mismatch-specific DNA-glycosylase [Chloroflexota bacterium]
MEAADALPTLPDYLAPGLDLVLVGINPSVYSVERGHYFARPTNRFWEVFSRSRLSAPIRLATALTRLGPEHDALLPRFGIGLTDLVKRPSPGAGTLAEEDYRIWAPRLLQRLEAARPRVVCFHGPTAYRPFCRYALGETVRHLALGPQPLTLGSSRLFVVPNPSAANARFGLAALVAWYDQLADFVQQTLSSTP